LEAHNIDGAPEDKVAHKRVAHEDDGPQDEEIKDVGACLHECARQHAHAGLEVHVLQDTQNHEENAAGKKTEKLKPRHPSKRLAELRESHVTGLRKITKDLRGGATNPFGQLQMKCNCNS
jgi:hypothetical protein